MLIVYIILLVLVCLTTLSIEMYMNIKCIPKIIWTYWDSDEIPDIISKCIESWKRYNPDHQVVLLNKANVPKYLTDIDIFKMKHATTPARTSDFIRLNILKKYGGIWMDASIICTRNLDWVHATCQNNVDVVGFYLENFTVNKRYPVIESWFIAAPIRSEFLRLWCNEFNSINMYDNVDDYVDIVKRNGVDISGIDAPNYLAIHVAAQKIMQKRLYPKMQLWSANKSPYLYLDNNNWDSEKALFDLCKNPSKYREPIIKIRGTEREKIKNNPELQCVIDMI